MAATTEAPGTEVARIGEECSTQAPAIHRAKITSPPEDLSVGEIRRIRAVCLRRKQVREVRQQQVQQIETDHRADMGAYLIRKGDAPRYRADLGSVGDLILQVAQRAGRAADTHVMSHSRTYASSLMYFLAFLQGASMRGTLLPDEAHETAYCGSEMPNTAAAHDMMLRHVPVVAHPSPRWAVAPEGMVRASVEAMAKIILRRFPALRPSSPVCLQALVAALPACLLQLNVAVAWLKNAVRTNIERREMLGYAHLAWLGIPHEDAVWPHAQSVRDELVHSAFLVPVFTMFPGLLQELMIPMTMAFPQRSVGACVIESFERRLCRVDVLAVPREADVPSERHVLLQCEVFRHACLERAFQSVPLDHGITREQRLKLQVSAERYLDFLANTDPEHHHKAVAGLLVVQTAEMIQAYLRKFLAHEHRTLPWPAGLLVVRLPRDRVRVCVLSQDPFECDLADFVFRLRPRLSWLVDPHSFVSTQEMEAAERNELEARCASLYRAMVVAPQGNPQAEDASGMGQHLIMEQILLRGCRDPESVLTQPQDHELDQTFRPFHAMCAVLEAVASPEAL